MLACEYHIKNKCDYSYDVRENRFECAKEQAVKALEKQIPKEVDDEWNCPNCNKNVYLAGDEIPKYCWHCGQHLK